MENYQLIRQIGHGAYGEVWLVKCSETRKKHVLKRIDLHQIPKGEQRAAYLEAKLLSTLKHPNLVKYLDSFHNSSGSIYIVMSYCELGNLQDYIKCRNGAFFDEKLIVQWLVQICLALKYLHDEKILHRNLKTKNLFLARNKAIKVGNIGVSKVLSMTQDMSSSLIETPYYISPENITGSSFSQKSDVWALGCCMYEIATLRHPYVAGDSHSLLQKMKKKLAPLPEIYSSDLYDIIISMLNPSAEKRPCVTNLLLNDYIRKYILLILQNGTKSHYDQYSEKSSSLSSGRSKSSSDLPHRLHDPLNGHLEKSRSISILPSTNPNRAKFSSLPQRPNSQASRDSTISVPDVNGNADGNDNSQDGLEYPYSNSLSSWADTDSWDGCSKYSAKSGNEHIKRSSTPLTSFEARVKTRQQKVRGEVSLKILQSLNHTLQTARSDYLVERENSSHPIIKSPKCSQAIRLLDSPLDEGKLVTISNAKKLGPNGVCSLPQINKAS